MAQRTRHPKFKFQTKNQNKPTPLRATEHEWLAQVVPSEVEGYHPLPTRSIMGTPYSKGWPTLLCNSKYWLALLCAVLCPLNGRSEGGADRELHFYGVSSARVTPSALLALSAPAESLRDELIRLQRSAGLSLVAVDGNKIYTVNFEARTLRERTIFSSKGTPVYGALSPDGTKVAFGLCPEPGLTHPTPQQTICPAGPFVLGVASTNGSDYREFPGLSPSFMCFSYDKSKLALNATNRKTDKFPFTAMEILNLNSGDTQKVAGMDTFVSSQCWSPDDKQFVYTVNYAHAVQSVRLYDVAENNSRSLAMGGNATWSPDGKWIAYLDCGIDLDDCTYYAIRPDGTGNRTLFKTTTPTVSALWWSPDSKVGAYVSVGRDEEGPEVSFRLRVVRLADNTEDWVVSLTEFDPQWFQWTTNADLLKQVEPQVKGHESNNPFQVTSVAERAPLPPIGSLVPRAESHDATLLTEPGSLPRNLPEVGQPSAPNFP